MIREVEENKMAAGRVEATRTNGQRRRRRHSLVRDNPDIEDDVLMASSIGDVKWLQQSLWNPRHVYKQSREHGLSPLHLAALHGHLDSIKVLIERYKVDVNLPSETGWTPLHLAINNKDKKRSLKCVKYLLQKGADPSRPNHNGTTPVHKASSEGHVKCLMELIKAGGIIDSQDSDGNTPMDLARVWAHRHCARILSNHQWFLDKEKHLYRKLEEEKKAREIAKEMERLSVLKRIEGRNEGQVAFKSWLSTKGIPDIPTRYGPLPMEERKAIFETKASKSYPVMSTAKSKPESSFVVKSKSEMGPSFARRTRAEIDEDKKLDLIPLDRVSASKRRQMQRTENMRLNRAKAVAASTSPATR